MNLRTLTAEDIEALVDDLWFPFAREMAELDSYNELSQDVDCRAEALSHRREQLEEDELRTIVADDEGTLVGYVSGEVSESAPVFARGAKLHIGELYVSPSYRQRGLATQLLEAIEAWGQSRGATYAELSVNVRNEPARACYDDQGYEKRRLKLTREF